MQMPKITVLTVLILIVAQTCAFAENLDKNKPILCAVMESHECIPNMPCKNVSAEEIHLPHFLLMDLKKGTITGTRTDGQALDSKIKDISTSDGRTFLQGVEHGKGWTVSISEKTGEMVISITSSEESFTVFGRCTAK